MPAIKCALLGVAADAQIKTSKSGKEYLAIELEPDEGEDGGKLWVASFQGVKRLVDLIKPGSHLYIKGKVKLNRWTGADGVARSALAITASEIEVLFEREPALDLNGRKSRGSGAYMAGGTDATFTSVPAPRDNKTKHERPFDDPIDDILHGPDHQLIAE
jgi:hypothetical protein